MSSVQTNRTELELKLHQPQTHEILVLFAVFGALASGLAMVSPRPPPPPTTTSIKFANFYLSNFFAAKPSMKIN